MYKFGLSVDVLLETVSFEPPAGGLGAAGGEVGSGLAQGS